MQYMTVTPAYGRDFTSQAEVKDAWAAGDDFVIASMGPDSGRYISCREVPPRTTIMVRYNRLTKVVAVN